MTKPEFHSRLEFNDEAKRAFDADSPVLALESTIITHGMPFPKNLDTALAVQAAVRDSGATPATIAVIDGKLKVGLEDVEIEALARQGEEATKCSRRDIPFLLNSGASGATTVAATMIIAEMAGIRVFATGGIGGVHRGAQAGMDISADLQELAKTNVAVVCAGPKAILDIGLTLEYLETHGVPVVGYQTDELPAFYSRSSGFNVDYRLDSASGIAAALKTKWSLGLTGGVVIANPIPAEAALDASLVEQFIAQAISEAGQHGISGKDLTPYLLSRVEELSGGESLKANIALILNNARLGAQIAAAVTR
ncbi:MAG: pseudouridine-5'-phosphate glycosidase [Lysobacterales bacterium]|jgi:pseudouridine-5'-phosphate glycosidase